MKEDAHGYSNPLPGNSDAGAYGAAGAVGAGRIE